MNQRAVRFQHGRYTRRHGMAVLIVLLLIAITLTTSYSVLRMQSVEIAIQQNANLTTSARQAAVSGILVGFSEMNGSNWTGVGTTLTRSLGNGESFQVTFEVGDPSLVLGDPDYNETPYRVTLIATGLAADPADPTRVVSHQIRAVARLIPRALAAEPTQWSDMSSHSLYQTHDDLVTINVPFRVEGPVRFRGNLNLSQDYLWSEGVRESYFTDLSSNHPNHTYDFRPFSGPLTLSTSELQSTIDFIDYRLNIVPTSASPMSSSGWSHPGSLTTYRLYPGGKLYNATLVDQTLSNEDYGPDPDSNPAGLFYRLGQVDLSGNVTLRGTLIVEGAISGNVNVMGPNIQLLPVDLPPLENTIEPVRLPLAVVGGDFRVLGNSSGILRGLVAVFDEFEIASANQFEINMVMESRVIARKILVNKRTEWDQSTAWWTDQYNAFVAQKKVNSFCQWLQSLTSLKPQTRIVITTEQVPARYHWQGPENPIYVPHPNDQGLRWDLLEWTDHP